MIYQDYNVLRRDVNNCEKSGDIVLLNCVRIQRALEI